MSAPAPASRGRGPTRGPSAVYRGHSTSRGNLDIRGGRQRVRTGSQPTASYVMAGGPRQGTQFGNSNQRATNGEGNANHGKGERGGFGRSGRSESTRVTQLPLFGHAIYHSSTLLPADAEKVHLLFHEALQGHFEVAAVSRPPLVLTRPVLFPCFMAPRIPRKNSSMT